FPGGLQAPRLHPKQPQHHLRSLEQQTLELLRWNHETAQEALRDHVRARRLAGQRPDLSEEVTAAQGAENLVARDDPRLTLEDDVEVPSLSPRRRTRSSAWKTFSSKECAIASTCIGDRSAKSASWASRSATSTCDF